MKGAATVGVLALCVAVAVIFYRRTTVRHSARAGTTSASTARSGKPTYLLTIAAARSGDDGVRLSPGIRLRETADRPAIGRMMQGAPLELRTPSGARYETTLVTYGVDVERGEDGALYMRRDPKDAEIKLTIPGELSPEAYAVGTEVWLLAE